MAVKDRLPDLRRRAGLSGAAAATAGAGVAAGEGAPAHVPHVAQLLLEVERVRGWIAEIAASTRRARALLADPGFHADRDLQQQLDAIVTGCNAAGLKVCGALRQLQHGARAAPPGAPARIAALQAACCRRAFSDALDAHHALLATAREQQLTLLRRHATIVNVALSEDECQSLLEDAGAGADTFSQLFVDNIRAETAEARLALRAVEARHGELLRVEGALREVRALFAQLAALLAAQQDAVDCVELCSAAASERVGEGHQQLLKGSIVRKKARKKKYGIIICIASGVILVLMVLILT